MVPALGQDALAADGEVDALAVGLVVDLDAGDELQGLVDGDRPRHRSEDGRLDDRGRGRVLFERDLDARRGDGDLDIRLRLGRGFFLDLRAGRRRLGGVLILESSREAKEDTAKRAVARSSVKAIGEKRAGSLDMRTPPYLN